MTKRVHGNDLLSVGPLRERSDVRCGFGVGKIRSEEGQPWLNANGQYLIIHSFGAIQIRVCFRKELSSRQKKGDIPMVYFDLMTCNGQCIINRIRSSMSWKMTLNGGIPPRES
jgi:hypothetical protein